MVGSASFRGSCSFLGQEQHINVMQPLVYTSILDRQLAEAGELLVSFLVSFHDVISCVYYRAI